MKNKLFMYHFFHRSGISIPANRYEKLFSIRVLAFILITLTAIILRIYVSFSHNLILGVDGGYYPVQVRNILNTGFLSFNDVPLYFYFCAFIVKVISFLGLTVTDEMIISVIKIVNSAALPLLAFPLFRFVSLKERAISIPASMSILAFAVLSFTPFFILGDLQKNAFAIPLVFIFILFLEDYLINPVRRNIIAVAILLAVIALTHFGVFVFSLAILIIALFIINRGKAIIPSLLIFFVGFELIALFDFDRAFRLITFWKVIFERPVLWQGPLPWPLLLNVLFSYILVGVGIFQFRRFKNRLGKASESMVLVLIVTIALFACPLVDMEYFQRFNVLLFVPQLLLIACLIRMNQKSALLFSISLVLLTTLSVFMYFTEEKEPCINDQTFHDLQNIKKYLSENKENSIIIARHGMEFWTAWALDVRVGQDRAINRIGLEKYSNVILLQQKSEDRRGQPGGRPRKNPGFAVWGYPPLGMGPRMGRPVPENFKLIYSSVNLDAYQKLK